MRSATLAAVVACLALAPAQAEAIVGGTAAPAGAYPATANVVISDAFGCTGTLIAPDWVLTAGHCSSLTGSTGVATPLASPPSSFAVTVGTVAASGSGGESLRVDRVVVPGDYLLTQGYDTSLLHLTTAARTAPTPIAGKGFEPLWGADVLTEVAGFGVTSEGGDAPSALQVVDLPIVTDARCGEVYGSAFEARTQLCAGYEAGGKDACQGDSGGPMYSRTAAGTLLLVAATSYGDGCAKPKTPGVYARVADATLREFVRSNAPAGVRDARAGEATAPARTYDPATGKVTGATGTPAAAPPRGAPRPTASVAVDRTRRSTFRSRGLRFRLRCSTACTARVALEVDARTAKALGRSRVLRTVTVRRAAGGRSTAGVSPGARLAKAVAARRGATLRIIARVQLRGRTLTTTRVAVLTGS